MNVKIAGLLAIALVLIGGVILLLHILEKEQPANEFTSISELMENLENFVNKTVRIKGTITGVSTRFGIEDNTGMIPLEGIKFEGGLSYNKGENVVISGIAKYVPFMSYGTSLSLSVENIGKAGEEKPLGLVEINEILENIKRFNESLDNIENEFLENIKKFENQTIMIKGTIMSIDTRLRISDNTGTILCYGWGESFSHTVGEKIIVEGRFYGYRYLIYPENILTTFMTLEIQTING